MHKHGGVCMRECERMRQGVWVLEIASLKWPPASHQRLSGFEGLGLRMPGDGGPYYPRAS
ncbi:hypothetical protein Baya_1891 [Bagarius yarrelli]|uniref:Uncharacterized protein n=1 Tax=Bagarius yarrelli TaxID=175774 RepID=A0A556TME2_BAGYA|nr:hypothetical protein Baya_1891 [Bagarius yarrelli]